MFCYTVQDGNNVRCIINTFLHSEKFRILIFEIYQTCSTGDFQFMNFFIRDICVYNACLSNCQTISKIIN